MDVRSCRDAGTTRREAQVRNNEPRSSKCALSRARPENSRFLLTDDFHGCRQLLPFWIMEGLPVTRARHNSKCEIGSSGHPQRAL